MKNHFWQLDGEVVHAILFLSCIYFEYLVPLTPISAPLTDKLMKPISHSELMALVDAAVAWAMLTHP